MQGMPQEWCPIGISPEDPGSFVVSGSTRPIFRHAWLAVAGQDTIGQ
jgi:hypothetical protein